MGSKESRYPSRNERHFRRDRTGTEKREPSPLLMPPCVAAARSGKAKSGRSETEDEDSESEVEDLGGSWQAQIAAAPRACTFRCCMRHSSFSEKQDFRRRPSGS